MKVYLCQNQYGENLQSFEGAVIFSDLETAKQRFAEMNDIALGEIWVHKTDLIGWNESNGGYWLMRFTSPNPYDHGKLRAIRILPIEVDRWLNGE